MLLTTVQYTDCEYDPSRCLIYTYRCALLKEILCDFERFTNSFQRTMAHPIATFIAKYHNVEITKGIILLVNEE
jgi:hypothetical protein